MKNEDTVENSYEPDMLMSPVKYAANCQLYARRELLLGDKILLRFFFIPSQAMEFKGPEVFEPILKSYFFAIFNLKNENDYTTQGIGL